MFTADGTLKVTDLGIAQFVGNAPTFASCVSGGTYSQAVSDEYQKASSTPYLQQDVGGQRGFGTPTVAVGQNVVDWQDPDWLTKLLNGSQSQ